tara:strand:+ start:136 stop:744 length:609 start_codon:yes stop_codon:yes gene_type:complete
MRKEKQNLDEGFIIVQKMVSSKNEAENYISENNSIKDLKYLEVNEYPTLGFNGEMNNFFVFEGFYSSEECKNILHKSDENKTAYFASRNKVNYFCYHYNSSNDKISTKSKFNNKTKLYRPIYITNVLLLITFYVLEVIAANMAGVEANMLSTIGKFLITRYFIRKMYSKNPHFSHKIIKTIGIYITLTIVWSLLTTLLKLSI